MEFLMSPDPMTNFEIQRYYQNEPKFNSIFSTNNLPKTKDGTNVINLEEYGNSGTQWVAIYVKYDVATSCDSF